MDRPGRNAPCPCGSGKKYKQCCLARAGLTPPPVTPTIEMAARHEQRGELLEAEAVCQALLQADPHHAEALHILGVAAHRAGRHAAAIDLLSKAIIADATVARYYSNLGGVLREQGMALESIGCCREAVRLDPGYAEARNNLGGVLAQEGHAFEAITHYREALRLKPDYAQALGNLIFLLQRLCDWSDLDALCGGARKVVRTQPCAELTPWAFLSMSDSPAEQLTCARNWATSRVAPAGRPRSSLGFRFTPTPKRTLRVGYLSPDFREHATSYLIAELFELHDRERIHVIGYSLGEDDRSAMRARVSRACDDFVDLRPLDATDAARRIYMDGVDILVDLAGYTTGSRPQILALRPAPIQVSFLGYPGTMGAECIDYIITDRFVSPPDQQRYFTERFAYLPDAYQINDRKRPVAERTPSRAECGLPDEGFVYCCFNSPYKITPAVFDVWMRLLKETPGSVLWLFQLNEVGSANLRREAAARGVAPERLVFAPKQGLAEHLARHRLADLFLDTLPVNAHTTASDALWAGLPVLTCAGETFAARVAGSLLHTIGLPELVTSSLGEYEALALRLAHGPAELAALKARLAANRDTSPLFDSARYTRDLEAVYCEMWSALVARAA